MANTVNCHNHGEYRETFVCSHLTEGSAGLGFNRNEPTEEDPFPYALCDDCDLIFQAQDGWSEEAETLIELRLHEDICIVDGEYYYVRGLQSWALRKRCDGSMGFSKPSEF